MYLPLCQFSKKNLIRYVLGKVSNFDLIFYVIRTLHKKTRQSLWPSLGRIGWDFFSKIGIEWGTYFVKNVLNFEIVWPAPATPRALTVKGVYEVSYSWYGQIIGCVCIWIIECPLFFPQGLDILPLRFFIANPHKISKKCQVFKICQKMVHRDQIKVY